MFAVLKTGGKQYRVSKDTELDVERLAANAGETVQFNDILMIGGDDGVTVGAPIVDGAAVQAEVVEEFRGKKVINLKRRRRKHSSRRVKGHRQYLTRVKVTEILASGGASTGIQAALGAGSVEKPAVVAEPAKAKPSKAKAKPAAEKAEAKPAKAEPAAEKTEAKPAPKAKAAPKEEPPAPAAAAKPANLLTEAQGTADDLKKISGVGPKLEGLLHENGVFHFWQIAEWGGNEIAYMDDKLSFKGRIERDNWIEQAKTFASES